MLTFNITEGKEAIQSNWPVLCLPLTYCILTFPCKELPFSCSSRMSGLKKSCSEDLKKMAVECVLAFLALPPDSAQSLRNNYYKGQSG